MELSSAIGAPAIRRINGTAYSIPRVTLADWAALQGILGLEISAKVPAWAKIARESGLNAELTAVMLREIDRSPSFTDCTRWVFTPVGAAAVLEIVLPRSSPALSVEQLQATMSATELVHLAADCCQLIGSTREKDDDPLPLAPGGSVTTG